MQAGIYWYASCDTCGLLRIDPLPDPAAVATMYDAGFFSAVSSGGYVDYVGDETVHRRNARRHLRRLQGFGRPGTLVEIGAAAGFLLDEARQSGWEVHGVEVSGAMISEAEERFGLKVVDDLSRLDLAAASVDVVLANQVVEHLVNPLETLIAAHELLRPGGRLVVETPVDAALGDSIAVDGVCLTVVEVADGRLAFDVVPETLSRVKPFGGRVNVETALRAGDPLGGHQVQGHVDGVGRVASVALEGDGRRARLELTPELLRYCVEKGSITVDGVSLTVATVDETGLEVALIPHTLEVTTLSELEPGSLVNVEVDVLAKYAERLLAGTMRP